MEIGEAWGNIGAVHLHLQNYGRAYEALIESRKHRPRDWKVTENLMITTLNMGRYDSLQ
jgi:hypothetical protein